MKQALIGIFLFFIVLILGSLIYGFFYARPVTSIASGVFALTQDAGLTWQSVNLKSESRSDFKVTGLAAFDSSEAGTFYVLSTLNNGLWKSVNGGKDWEIIMSQGINFTEPVGALIIDKANPNNLFVASSRAGYGQILRSKTAGETFTSIYETNGVGIMVSALEVEADNHQIIYAGTNDNGLLLISEDFGTHWRPLNQFREGVKAIVSTRNSNDIFVLTDRQAWRYDGENWLQLTGGRKLQLRHEPRRLVVSPARPTTLFITAGSELWRSDNRGESWESVPLPAHKDARAEITDFAISPSSPNVLGVAFPSLILISPSNGQNWRVAEPPLRGGISRIIFDLKTDQTLFVATY